METEQTTQEPKQDKIQTSNPDSDIIATLRAEIESLKAIVGKDNETLNDKVKNERDEREKKEANEKALEQALIFTLQSESFLKQNESILPKTMGEIFTAASKEKYDSPIQRANAIKAALISEFFSVQANIDLLTPALRESFENWSKLTKNGREERAPEMYINIFEPTLEVTKRIKRAEELQRSKNGYGNPTDMEKAYALRLQKLSNSHYGVKERN